jgi:hypothetical protein
MKKGQRKGKKERLRRKSERKNESQFTVCRREDHSRRSSLVKDTERRDEVIWVSKKYETKTKGRRMDREKQAVVEIETHIKPQMKTVYSMPVVYVPVNPKKTGEGEVV